MVGTFWGKKSLKALSNKVFRFIQQALYIFTFPKMFWRKSFIVETTIENIFNNWFFLRKQITILHLDENPSF